MAGGVPDERIWETADGASPVLGEPADQEKLGVAAAVGSSSAIYSMLCRLAQFAAQAPPQTTPP